MNASSMRTLFRALVLAAVVLAVLATAPAVEARCLDLPCGGYVRAGARAPAVRSAVRPAAEPQPAALVTTEALAAQPAVAGEQPLGDAPSMPETPGQAPMRNRGLLVHPLNCDGPPIDVPDGAAVTLLCASATLP